MPDLPTQAFQETTIVEIFNGLEESTLALSVKELRGVVLQAIETFDFYSLELYMRVASQLKDALEWTDKQITQAQCICLYHAYLMFYKNDNCDESRRFLQKLYIRYKGT